MPDIEYISPRSEEIHDIMERTPNWMMRWGISLFFVFLVILLGISWFIQYPDVINANIIITSEHPPINLVARSSGKLKYLFITDKEKIDSNTVLALIENAAEYKDVLSLKKFIADSSYLSKILPCYQLGDIESAYSVFKQAAEDYNTFKSIALCGHEIAAIEKQEASQQLLYNLTLQQFHTLTEEYELSTVKYQADSQLYAKGVIPKLDFNTSRNTLLEKKYAWQGANSALTQIQVQINELEATLTETVLQNQTDKAKYSTNLYKSLEELRTAIEIWEQKYIIISPIRGTVNLFNYWSVNMPVKEGDVLMIVIPEKTGAVIGKINMPSYGSAKVKEGQVVNIRLANYPFEEYGILIGKIRSVSLLPKDSLYRVQVIFPYGMKSSYNKQLDFKQQMTGSAEIVTENKRLIERILNRIKI